MSGPAKRVSPISRQVKSFLLKLIVEQKIIADKRTHGSIVVAKQRAWENILLSFNSAGVGGPVRSLNQLQKIWDYLKQTAKKEHTLYNRELRKTDGGDPPPPESEDTKFIMDFIKDEFKVPDNEFDCDSVKPALIQQDQPESHQDTPVCTIFLGEEDFIDADLLDATEIPNQLGPHGRAAGNSTVVATCVESTVHYNQYTKCSWSIWWY
ncbi:hypothetical protein Pmani_018117 [Petrolisthes manimaculis]|uniref:Regulatory protein zeste n=1 Tax=Petrolisthes manimaculis TaxID=1843537 RepID=A0AAE1PLL1_9EUCA|nr:hypothetical protein Pmani_018117 [Petrolisthes manimaculis]